MPPQIESRAMIIMQTVIALLLGVFINSVWGLPEKLNNLQNQVTRIEAQLTMAVTDRYTGTEAHKDLEVQAGVNTNTQQRLDIHQGILTRQQTTIDRLDNAALRR